MALEQLRSGILFFSLLALLILYFALSSSSGSVHTVRQGRYGAKGFFCLMWQLFMMACILGAYQEGLWTISSVGLQSQWPWLSSFTIGAVLCFPFIAVERYLYGF